MDAAAARTYTPLPGLDFPGNDLVEGYREGVTVWQCQAVCDALPHCALALFFATTGECYPKWGMGAEISVDADATALVPVTGALNNTFMR